MNYNWLHYHARHGLLQKVPMVLCQCQAYAAAKGSDVAAGHWQLTKVWLGFGMACPVSRSALMIEARPDASKAPMTIGISSRLQSSDDGLHSQVHPKLRRWTVGPDAARALIVLARDGDSQIMLGPDTQKPRR